MNWYRYPEKAVKLKKSGTFSGCVFPLWNPDRSQGFGVSGHDTKWLERSKNRSRSLPAIRTIRNGHRLMIVVVIVLSWLWLAKIWGVFILWVIFLNFWHNFLEVSFHTTSNFFNFKNLCDPIVPETFCCNIRHQCPGLTDLNCRRFWWRLTYQPGGTIGCYVPAECMYFSWNMQPKYKIIIKYTQAKFDRYMKLWISANTNEPQKNMQKNIVLTTFGLERSPFSGSDLQSWLPFWGREPNL